MGFVLGRRSRERLMGVHPDLVRVVEMAIELTPVDFAVVQGVRTQAEQDALYAQGRTKPGKIVTWTRNSRHIGGYAVDLAAFVDGKISWDEKHYPEIVEAMKMAAKECGVAIKCGADFPPKQRDLPHFELDRKVYP